VAPSPYYRGLIGDSPRDSVGSGPEEAPAGLALRATQVEKVGPPPALEEFGAPSGLGGFRGSCAVSSALGVRGLVTFGDSSPTEALFVEGFGLMPWGTLHRGSQFTN
jgi:hypothetical protein